MGQLTASEPKEGCLAVFQLCLESGLNDCLFLCGVWRFLVCRPFRCLICLIGIILLPVHTKFLIASMADMESQKIVIMFHSWCLGMKNAQVDFLFDIQSRL
ncbi:hypothetical protein OUZ56_032050 [Daphnia magna]|uniref:Uncharacterized protein n=1 Tax=Daphnia magna TaxID=35525 RepID=A0ABQ9ZWD4_9CRUS|nr:hypothetical protein OUZ56_032050 [Daphnia magna]